MSRKPLSLAVAALFLLFPASLIAGGPPWLCLPIDGVTTANAKASAELLTTKLIDKISPHTRGGHTVEVREHSGQWYLTFHMGDNVGLGDVEAALKGTNLSIPRDRLRLFGHVILEVDAQKSTPEKLLADLDALNYTAIEKSEPKDDRLLVTIDLPYPVEDGNRERGSVAWDSFSRNDLSFDQAARSDPPATPETLPSYKAFRDVVTRHKASLKDIRWSQQYACRPLGGVTLPDTAQARAD